MRHRRRSGRLGVGVIGAGYIGQVAHLANLIAYDRCEVLALAELRPDLGAAVAARYHVPLVYASHRAMLENPAIEAVVVVTRRPALGPIVLDSLHAGKHVLSEKPMAHTFEQAERLVEAARKSDLCYEVGFMKRHDPGILRAQELLRELRQTGELGHLQMLRGYSLHGDIELHAESFPMTDEARPEGLELWSLAPEWLPESMREGYAAFLNVHTHILNLLDFLWHDEVDVQWADFDSITGGCVRMKIGPVPAILELRDASSGPWTEGVDFYFELGSVHVQLPAPFAKDRVATVTKRTKNGEQSIPALGTGWAFERQSQDWVDDILDARKPIASGEASVRDIALAEKMWRCYAALSR